MRWRVPLIVSACVNVALLALWLSARKTSQHVPTSPAETRESRSRTEVVVRRQFFTWSTLESPDYATYIANLRDVACPEQTIRDIIIADVNALFARRRAREIPTAEQQWWRSTPDSGLAIAAARKEQELENERIALLDRLLGPDWDTTGSVASRQRKTGVSLDGEILGLLPEQTKIAINQVMALSQQRMDELQIAAARLGRQPTSAELAAVRDQTRVELQKLLTPPQLEEFLLRYSQGAKDLRTELGSLRYFNVTPNEFRALFQARDPYDQKIAALAGSTNPEDVRQRKSLEQQRDASVKVALGDRRYEQYVQLHDPNFRTAWAQALQAGDPDAAGTLYDINQAAQAEYSRIRAGSNSLTPQQIAVEMKRAELEKSKAVVEAVGQEVPPDPNAPPTPPPVPQNRIHTIKTGDTLGSLSTAYGVPVNVIIDANPDLQINRLKPGQKLIIPPAQ